MILENGVVRTMEPVAARRAGARDRGRPRRRWRRRPRDGARDARDRRPRRPLRPPGLHRLARPLPDLVARAAAGEARRLRVARGGARARARGRDAAGPLAARLRLARAATGAPVVEPTKEALDEVTGETPTILISKDYHSRLAQLGGARGRGRRPRRSTAASSSATRSGEPTGVLREESAWRFRDRYVVTTMDEWVEATRLGLRLAASRGVGAIHDKDGWLGAPGIFQRLRDEGAPDPARLGLDPGRARRARGRAVAALRLRRRLPARRLPQVLHGRHARLADRAPDRRQRRRDHEPRGARGDHPPRRGGRLARRRARDRRPGEPRTRSTRSRRRRTPGGRSGCGTASSTRSA